MAPEAVEKEIVGLERQCWKAIKEKDIDAAISLTDNPCIIAGA